MEWEADPPFCMGLGREWEDMKNHLLHIRHLNMHPHPKQWNGFLLTWYPSALTTKHRRQQTEVRWSCDCYGTAYLIESWILTSDDTNSSLVLLHSPGSERTNCLKFGVLVIHTVYIICKRILIKTYV